MTAPENALETAECAGAQEAVATGQFIAMALGAVKAAEGPEDCMEYAAKRLIAEERDILNAEKPIERRSAARILHRVLSLELGEADEADWSAAERLKDLYSCHACVSHIAQVYAKGIMPGRREDLFDLEGHMTREEAADMIARMAHREQRRKMEPLKSAVRGITPDRAFEMLAAGSARLVDVRSGEEYSRGHIEGAENAPLGELEKNPHRLGDKGAALILYCRSGIRSRMAAGILAEAGFREIYTIPGVEQYDYPESGCLTAEADSHSHADPLAVKLTVQ